MRVGMQSWRHYAVADNGQQAVSQVRAGLIFSSIQFYYSYASSCKQILCITYNTINLPQRGGNNDSRAPDWLIEWLTDHAVTQLFATNALLGTAVIYYLLFEFLLHAFTFDNCMQDPGANLRKRLTRVAVR